MRPRMETWVGFLGHTYVLAPCAITELGFVRAGTQAGLSPDAAAARAFLSLLKSSTHPAFVLLPDDLGCETLPDRVRTPARTGGGHLLALAVAHDAQLVTVDTGIPAAVRIE